VSDFLNTLPQKCIKTVVFKADDRLDVELSRVDHEINDIKLKKALDAQTVELADPLEVKEHLQCEIGSLGPIKLPVGIKVFADHAVKSITNGVCGANEEGWHYTGVNPGRDFSVDEYGDFRFIMEGDPSPDGIGTVKFAKGIEVGHIFKLGTTYSIPMDGTFLDENGKSQPYIMGCYGIGVSRVMAAVAEQFNDENGFVWPKPLSPYDIHLIPVNMKDETQVQMAEELYKLLKSYRYEVLFDDRTERAGVKFADADLIGLPVRVTIGKRAAEGIIELKYRSSGETIEVQKEELLEKMQAFFNSQ